MTIVETIDAAILEAEQIRARHDGVHAIHNCICGLRLLRDIATAGDWDGWADGVLRTTMARLRAIDRTGFDTPHLSAEIAPAAFVRGSMAEIGA